MIKNEFSIDQQEDEDLRCPICNYYFSEITKPFLLPCNHNLCLACIDCIIEKKMLNCPICRKIFKEEEKKNFQVNFAFLNLVIKILKSKVIFCKKCSKIYNWVDHYNICDQRDFIETNEMIEQIKKLAEESYSILKSIERHKNVLSRSKQSIFESTHDILKIINLKFFENYQKTIESFFANIPVLNYNLFIRDLKKFLDLCRPLDSKLNLAMNDLVINDSEEITKFQNSDEDFDLKKRTKSYQKGNKTGLAHFNLLKHNQNLKNSDKKFDLHLNKNKALNYSSYLDENLVKDKIRSMLTTNTTHYRSNKIMNLSTNNVNLNIYRQFSADKPGKPEKHYLMKGLSKKSLPIEEDDEEDNSSVYRGVNYKLPYGRNFSKDNINDRETIKMDFAGKRNNFNQLNTYRKNIKVETNSSAEDINNLDDEANFVDLDSHFEEDKYYSSGIDANYNMDINENTAGIWNIPHIPNVTQVRKNKKNISDKNLDNLNNVNKVNKIMTSPKKPIINVPKQMDPKLIINDVNILNTSNNFAIDDPYSPEKKVFLPGDDALNNLKFPSSNTNFSNMNYNFNLNQIFNASNSEAAEKGKNTAKKKIIVNNNEVKIVNVNIKSENVNLDVEKESPIIDKKLSRSFHDNQNILNEISKSTEIKIYNGKNISAKKLYHKPPLDTKNKNDTPQNPHDAINKILAEYNKTKEIVDKIQNYTKQIELTSETIQGQISTNFNHLQESITKNVNSLCDNITVGFSHNYRQNLIYFMENTKKINLFNVKKMKPEFKEFEFLKFKFNNSMSIDYDDDDLIFISGGRIYSSSIFESEYTFTNNFLILRWSNRTVELSGQMPRKRAFHSSIFVDGKLYVIGGLSTTISTSHSNAQSNQVVNVRECECYNWNEKRWELMPSMNSARCNASLSIYNGTYLYAFRGWVNSNSNECNFLDTIEFININNISNGWTMFKPEDPGLCWKPGSNSISTVIGENKIMICGGIFNCSYSVDGNSSGGILENKLSNICYIYDPVRKSVYRSMDLVKASSFNNVGAVYENKLIMVDHKNETNKPFGIHFYEIENNIWKFNQI